jgi:hypothetical protein
MIYDFNKADRRGGKLFSKRNGSLDHRENHIGRIYAHARRVRRILARAIRDHRRADPLFVSPFIFARIFLEPVKRVIFDASARINLVRMVHGDVDVKWYRPFRMERSVRYTLSVKDIR